MAAGLGAYRTVLADSSARAFTGAGFIARLPISMTGLGIVLLISITSGSFGRAGLVIACLTVASALGSPAWGRLSDRVGQAQVLLTTVTIYSVGVSALVLTVMLQLPLIVTCLAAVLAGIGNSQAGASVRARWTHHLSDPHHLDTAYAFEAVVDEVIFIVGPVLATFLATSIHPALGLVVCLVLAITGTLALASQRGSQPPIRSRQDSADHKTRISPALLIPIVFACAALGALFGGMEVTIVAFATEAGLLPFAGVGVMCWSAGSLIAGVVTGTVRWRVSPARRFRVSALILGLSMLPLPFVSHPALVAGLLMVSGLAIAPTLIASVAVTQTSVPPDRLTEALGWTNMGMATGVALGAAGLGQLIDTMGARAGFWGTLTCGGILIVAALCVRAAKVPLVPKTRQHEATVS